MDAEWNWQSSAPCDVTALTDGDLDDDSLLAVASRYTVENLILNAVHEIGEWLRFDGARLFPAHLARTDGFADSEDQGNGAVRVQITFGSDAGFAPVTPDQVACTHSTERTLVARLAEYAASSRFTYVPNAAISFETAGPVTHWRPNRGAPSVWRSSWSASALPAAGAPAEELIMRAGRDVHRALVFFEVDRICRAFHVDDRQRWRLAIPYPTLQTEPRGDDPQADLLAISISYSNALTKSTDHRQKIPGDWA